MPELKYEREDGTISQVLVSSKKAAIMGTEAAGTIQDVRVRVAASGSTKRKLTLVARRALYLRSDAVGTTGRVSTQRLELPILTKAAVATVPETVTYNSKSDWKLKDIIPED